MPQDKPKYSLAYKERLKEKPEEKAIIKPKVEGEWHGNFLGDQPGTTLDRNLINPDERWLDSVKYKETKI
jgi:hypothetical protein